MTQYTDRFTNKTVYSDNYSVNINGITSRIPIKSINEATEEISSNSIEETTRFIDIKQYDQDWNPSLISHQPLNEILNMQDIPVKITDNESVYITQLGFPLKLAEEHYSFTNNSVLISYAGFLPEEENINNNNSNDSNDNNQKNKYILASSINLKDPSSTTKISKLAFTYQDAKINKTFLTETVSPGVFHTTDLQKLQEDVYNFYRDTYKDIFPKGENITIRNFTLQFLSTNIFPLFFSASNNHNDNATYYAGVNFVTFQKNPFKRTRIKPNTIGILKENVSNDGTLNITYFADIPFPTNAEGFYLTDFTVDNNNLIYLYASTTADYIVVYDLSDPEKITQKAVLQHPLYRKILNWKILFDTFILGFKYNGVSVNTTLYCKNNILYTHYNDTYYVYDISDFKSIKPVARFTDTWNTFSSNTIISQMDKNNFYVQSAPGNNPSTRVYFQINNASSTQNKD